MPLLPLLNDWIASSAFVSFNSNTQLLFSLINLARLIATLSHHLFSPSLLLLSGFGEIVFLPMDKGKEGFSDIFVQIPEAQYAPSAF